LPSQVYLPSAMSESDLPSAIVPLVKLELQER
jgi:hypothetical protein